jgi:nucleoside-diphosphate-sugar epimerase
VTRGPLAGVPGVVGRHVMLRLRAATHEVRTLVDAEVSVLVRASSTVVEHHHHHEHVVEPLDDAAGGEFVDDRIRESD